MCHRTKKKEQKTNYQTRFKVFLKKREDEKRRV